MSIMYSIAEIERETGINRDCLRVWERRYGFPAPLRNQCGERVYSSKQLERLRLIKQLLDRGLRPGKLLVHDDKHLRNLASQQSKHLAVSTEVGMLLEILAGGSQRSLLNRMQEQLEQLGLRNFILNIVAPMNHAVGNAWFEGRIGILDEHHYAEVVRLVLSVALSRLPLDKGFLPSVLLTTLPGEQHGLGLLMVACMFRLEEAEVLSLGVQTPLQEIVRGAVHNQCQIVGISCSEYLNSRTIATQLIRLRKLLPDHVAIWAGGSGIGSVKLLSPNIRMFSDLVQLQTAIRATIS